MSIFLAHAQVFQAQPNAALVRAIRVRAPGLATDCGLGLSVGACNLLAGVGQGAGGLCRRHLWRNGRLLGLCIKLGSRRILGRLLLTLEVGGNLGLHFLQLDPVSSQVDGHDQADHATVQMHRYRLRLAMGLELCPLELAGEVAVVVAVQRRQAAIGLQVDRADRGRRVAVVVNADQLQGCALRLWHHAAGVQGRSVLAQGVHPVLPAAQMRLAHQVNEMAIGPCRVPLVDGVRPACDGRRSWLLLQVFQVGRLELGVRLGFFLILFRLFARLSGLQAGIKLALVLVCLSVHLLNGFAGLSNALGAAAHVLHIERALVHLGQEVVERLGIALVAVKLVAPVGCGRLPGDGLGVGAWNGLIIPGLADQRTLHPC